MRPVPDESEDQGRTPGTADGGEAGDHEHRGRDAVREPGRETGREPVRDAGQAGAVRRSMTGDRSAVQSAAAGTPTVTATVTPQVPSAALAPPKTPVPPPVTATPQPQQPARRKAPRQNRRPSGRERHDEKITVYVSAEELMDLEHARLVLRGEHGLAIDRGRIVREAVAVVLADLESRGDASILVRRLRGR
ncbi:hypothetical protein [Actinacidiphila rubida]|uniref:hypothetical protein n=1 Tax=Actinacidiphila rubida TaxID=310780 RepID=UPI00099F6CE1|nr:hypothetical protein [Actinacidiphila rubida]